MERVARFDTMRGIAATVVVSYHLALVMPGVPDPIAATGVGRLLVAGPQMVQVFFVLSGFALVHMTARAESYRRFLFERFVRLYLPTAAAILASAALCALLAKRQVAGTSDWFTSQSWLGPPTAGRLLGNLLLLDSTYYRDLENVAWSLSEELRISLVFPLFVLAVRQHWRVTLVALFTMAVLHWRSHPEDAGAALRPHLMLADLYLFAAGAAMAVHWPAMRARATPGLAGPTLVAAIVLLASQADLHPTPLTGLGAVLLVLGVALMPAVPRWSEGKLPREAARLSFSIYLMHLPVVLTLVHGLGDRVALPLLLAAALPVTLLAALLFHRWIEVPSHRLARRAARRPPASAASPAVVQTLAA